MIALVLDLASVKGKAGFFDTKKNKVVQEAFLGEGPVSGLLFSALQEAGRKRGISLKNVDFLITTLGPGSFTGVRLGVSVGRAFHLATQKPVVGVETFSLLAHQFLEKKGGSYPFIVALEGKRKDVCCQLFISSSAEAKKEIFWILPEEIDRVLPSLEGNRKGGGIGEGMKRLLPYLPEAWKENICPEHVSLETLGKRGSQLFFQEENKEKFSRLFPFYGREADVTLSSLS